MHHEVQGVRGRDRRGSRLRSGPRHHAAADAQIQHPATDELQKQ